MKFRDPKTREVFDDIEKARTKFCTGMCSKCALNDYNSLLNCREYYSDSPAEAARLMGYEVVGDHDGEDMCCDCAEGGPCCDFSENEDCLSRKEDGSCWSPYTEKDDPMEKTDKPRICETLGGKDDPLEVGEQFGISTIPGVVFWICQDGTFDTCPGKVSKSAYHFLRAVEHPDRIIRKPRFTEEEVALLRALYAAGARYLARGKHLRWYHNKPYQRAEDGKWDMQGDWGTMSGKLPAKLFPSLRPGQAVKLEKVTGEKDG